MTRSSTAFASLALLAAFAAAPLAARAAEAGNVVGGGSATISGGGDDMRIAYSIGGAGGGGGGVLTQSGRLAGFAGTDGDGLQVAYLAPAPAGAGREAWLVGGGEDAQVVYK
jgi:hypothetical protein